MKREKLYFARNYPNQTEPFQVSEYHTVEYFEEIKKLNKPDYKQDIVKTNKTAEFIYSLSSSDAYSDRILKLFLSKKSVQDLIDSQPKNYFGNVYVNEHLLEDTIQEQQWWNCII